MGSAVTSARGWILGVSAVAVAVLAVQVVTGSGIVHADVSVRAWIRAHQIGWLHATADGAVSVLTPVADVVAALAVAAAVAYRRKQPTLWWSTLRGVALLAVIVLGLKYGIDRRGPQELDPGRGAFPSGHTASIAVCGVLLWRLLRRGHRAGAAILSGIIAIVGLSLLYVDAHWFSDVVAALFVAALVVAATPPVPGVSVRDGQRVA